MIRLLERELLNFYPILTTTIGIFKKLCYNLKQICAMLGCFLMMHFLTKRIYFLIFGLLFSSNLLADTRLVFCDIPKESKTILKKAPGLSPKVLRLAMQAHNNALRKGIKISRNYLTIIDFTKPSSKKRLWVIDLKHDTVLYHLHVAHGRNSGVNKPKYFSNQPGSKESSLGLYKTAGTYVGNDGYTLRLDGLEPGINNNARRRLIVIHGARYVSPNFLRVYGRLGRSWGCPAVNRKYIKPLINRIKDGSLVFMYYPQKILVKPF